MWKLTEIENTLTVVCKECKCNNVYLSTKHCAKSVAADFIIAAWLQGTELVFDFLLFKATLRYISSY